MQEEPISHPAAHTSAIALRWEGNCGDPGAIRWAASLPCACEAPLRCERATPSFGGWWKKQWIRI